MRFLCTYILLVFISLSVFGANKKQCSDYRSPFLPDHIVGQFAGNIGVLSAGFGYESNSGRLSSDLLIGYVPYFIGDATIFTISQKNTFKGRNFKNEKIHNIYPSAGFSINIETGRNSFLTLPDQYPEGYYATNAIKVGLFAGLTYQGKVSANSLFKQFEYYAEVGTLGSYIFYNIKREEYLNPDIFSLALGVKINLW